MLFRIENTQDDNAYSRIYEIYEENLPKMKICDLEKYLATKIREAVNNSNNRTLLNYSKSLGICLLKYNPYTDNELHICTNTNLDYVIVYDIEGKKHLIIPFDIKKGLLIKALNNDFKEICLKNFVIDISDNYYLDLFLKDTLDVRRKKYASPEKDKEVLLMQLPCNTKDLIISEYISSIYLLYGLFMKYGMNNDVYNNLIKKIYSLDEFRFTFCHSSEKEAILTIINYLYKFGNMDVYMCENIYKDSIKKSHIPAYYDSILQFHDIQNDDFATSFNLSDYNNNVISDSIWDVYSQYINVY